ncbi:MAG: thiamine pyrophosphate-dependent dehydrogenase E1 component subunit alpha [Actinobacteria bacterium]|nr:thiamine pyrophosphate-dependent dehydrogenase E1 component subunit alpha [Actinomycetota bacterium]
MKVNGEPLYRQMARMRFFEEALADLWERGLISGEMHLGVGEEAVVAGVTAHLEEGDAMALDHRSTPPLVARGVDLVSLFLEMLGDAQGLCGGWGGHMHLFSREHLACSSGIVGSSAPLGAGFALAAQHLGRGKVAVSFFGEGAANQGMLLESLNLAAAWKLPQVFVCKDNRWAITTRSRAVTGGDLVRRARSFGMPACRVDGTCVEAVWEAAGRAVRRARAGRGPSFLLATCPRPEGHFLGDPLLRVYREPLKQTLEIGPPLLRSLFSKPLQAFALRPLYLGIIGKTLAVLGTEKYLLCRDPLCRAARLVPEDTRRRIEEEAREEVARAVAEAMERRERHA